MRRREFLSVLGGAAVTWPCAARAQQRSATPVIGFFHLMSAELTRDNLAAFQRGLGEAGYVEDRNVTIEYRWALGQNDRLPVIAAELVRREVSVIVILESTHGALSAKAATQKIPIIFLQGADPVRIGLVGSLSRPGGNLTGFGLVMAEVVAKRLEILLELLPGTKSVAYLRNPTNPAYAESETKEVQAAADKFGVRLSLMNASDLRGVDVAFDSIVQQKIGAILVSSDGFLLTNSKHVVALAASHSVPAIYGWRAAGALISYGPDLIDGWRQAGIYTGRILKGEKPADLPVQQVRKIEMIVNLKTAKTLALTVPQALLARADEVIE
jgi:putative tryptophan/tyrosine transport system substrate-binding protein